MKLLSSLSIIIIDFFFLILTPELTPIRLRSAEDCSLMDMQALNFENHKTQY